MLRSFRATVGVDPGFEPAGLLTAAVALPRSRKDFSYAFLRLLP